MSVSLLGSAEPLVRFPCQAVGNIEKEILAVRVVLSWWNHEVKLLVRSITFTFTNPKYEYLLAE